MQTLLTRLPQLSLLLAVMTIAGSSSVVAADEDEEALAENNCVTCHGNQDLWEGETQHLHVTASDLLADIHWQKEIRCHDCHGGNPNTFKVGEAHAIEDGFRTIEKPADVPGFCGHCHSNLAYMRNYHPTVEADPVADFWTSVHGQHLRKANDDQAATCLSCHRRHEMRAVEDTASAVHPSHLSETCGNCHQEQWAAGREDVHGKPAEDTQVDATLPLNCSQCHGENVHSMLAAKDPGSPVFVNQQLKTCGGCHEEGLHSYLASVHGHGLIASGLLVSAVCSDCHGAHGIFPAAQPDSRLYVTNVASTCAKCHRFIEQRLQASVHGRGAGLGGVTEKAAPGGTVMRKPTCTDCHQGHDLPHPQSTASRILMPDRCGNCHAELSDRYQLSVHGELTELGYGPAAKCSDCHGAHDILSVSDVQSTVSPGQRPDTCKKCHPNAAEHFLDFDPHADHHDPERDPLLHWVYIVLMTFIVGTFGVFGLHALFWFTRSLVEVRRNGRPRQLTPGAVAYVRFARFHRSAHVLLLVSFLGLAVTGLPLKYSHTVWAQTVIWLLGGFASTSVWHRIFGLMNISCLIIYCARMLARLLTGPAKGSPRSSVIFGPDSPVPAGRDVRDFFKTIRWFVGRGPKPTYERWAYWEKFDFWGAFADIILIGSTGLILWFPNFFCIYLPGQALNIAKVIHSTQALLATGFVFAIHFFSTHLRPERFPMDVSIFTGLVSDEELREERPEYYERLRQEGRLDAMRTTVPSRRFLWSAMLGGTIALAVGTLLLVGMLAAAWGG